MRAKFWLIALGIATCSPALSDEIKPPPKFLGIWARDGKCTNKKARLTIGAHQAKMGTAPPMAIWFDSDAHGLDATMLWKEEGSADNFVLDLKRDIVIYNPEGFGMSAVATSVPYKRCAR